MILNIYHLQITINVISIVKSTFYIILLPVLSGLFLKIILREKEFKYFKFFPFFSEIVIAFIIAVIFALNFDNLNNVSMLMVVGVVLHNLIGLILALLISIILKYPDDVKRTIAIEVGMQNSGLGMTLALLHFSKIVALPSALFSLWHNISAAGLVYLWKKK